MKRRIEREERPKPKPSLRERMRDQMGLSDLELADIYNLAFGSSYPSPLRDKQVKELYDRR